jgi:steroid delta-isomerase-like uncharacterized protein
MSEQEDVIRRFIDALNRRDFDTVDEVLSDDLVFHGGSFGEITGREPFKEFAGPFFVGFPDLQLKLHDVIADGDRVALRFTSSGTHNGEFSGIPATGKTVSFTEQPQYRVADGKIVEIWWLADIFGLMQELGAIPSG